MILMLHYAMAICKRVLPFNIYKFNHFLSSVYGIGKDDRTGDWLSASSCTHDRTEW